MKAQKSISAITVKGLWQMKKMFNGSSYEQKWDFRIGFIVWLISQKEK